MTINTINNTNVHIQNNKVSYKTWKSVVPIANCERTRERMNAGQPFGSKRARERTVKT